MNITYENTRTRVLHMLQAMGKRYIDKEGNSHYTRVTVSTAEYALIDDYIKRAARDIMSALPDLISAYTEGATSVTFDVDNTRWGNSNLQDIFEKMCEDYCVSSAASQYYSMYFQEQSAYNQQRCQQLMAQLIAVSRQKTPIVSSDSPIEVSGTVTQL